MLEEAGDWSDVKLGYIYAPDVRDYPMAAELVASVPVGIGYRYHVPGPTLDQKQTNSCVGFGCAQWAQTSPIRTKLAPDFGLTIYRRALEIDEFWGEADNGTSVRAGVRVLEEQGRVARYVWAASAEEVKQWILLYGSVIVGTTFTQGMRDIKGPGWYMLPTGNPLGGHCYLLTGYSLSRHAFRMINSWGSLWGDKGRAWLKYGDLDILLRSQGDAIGIIEKAPGL